MIWIRLYIYKAYIYNIFDDNYLQIHKDYEPKGQYCCWICLQCCFHGLHLTGGASDGPFHAAQFQAEIRDVKIWWPVHRDVLSWLSWFGATWCCNMLLFIYIYICFFQMYNINQAVFINPFFWRDHKFGFSPNGQARASWGALMFPLRIKIRCQAAYSEALLVGTKSCCGQ